LWLAAMDVDGAAATMPVTAAAAPSVSRDFFSLDIYFSREAAVETGR
jgi:hypothetical protein